MTNSPFNYNGLEAMIRNTILAAILIFLLTLLSNFITETESNISQLVICSLVFGLILSEIFRLSSPLWNPVSPRAYIHIAGNSKAYLTARIINTVLIFIIVAFVFLYIRGKAEDSDGEGIRDSADEILTIILVAVAFGIGGKTGSKGDDSPKSPSTGDN